MVNVYINSNPYGSVCTFSISCTCLAELWAGFPLRVGFDSLAPLCPGCLQVTWAHYSWADGQCKQRSLQPDYTGASVQDARAEVARSLQLHMGRMPSVFPRSFVGICRRHGTRGKERWCRNMSVQKLFGWEDVGRGGRNPCVFGSVETFKDFMTDEDGTRSAAWFSKRVQEVFRLVGGLSGVPSYLLKKCLDPQGKIWEWVKTYHYLHK